MEAERYREVGKNPIKNKVVIPSLPKLYLKAGLKKQATKKLLESTRLRFGNDSIVRGKEVKPWS
jgi:hypothetical protein